MRVFALNGNLFGPGTGGTPADAMQALRHNYLRPVFEITRSEGGVVTTVDGTQVAFQTLVDEWAFVTPASAHQYWMAERPPNFIPRESFVFVDAHPGGRITTLNIATNYAILLNDYQGLDVFNLREFRPVLGLGELRHGDMWTEEGHTLLCYEDVLFRQASLPLAKDGRALEHSLDFFALNVVRDVEMIDAPVVEEPVLYLNWGSSANYNIFIHELAIEALRLHRLPPNTKVMIGREGYKTEVMDALGIPRNRLLIATEPVRLRRVYLPVRKLNLKYVGPMLIDAYQRMRTSLRNGANLSPGRKIHLSRKVVAANTGANRFILNQAELDASLQAGGFENVFGEGLTLKQKYEAISCAEVVVSPIGANLVNIGLADDIKKIILLTSPVWHHFKWYWYSLLKMLHPQAEIVLFEDCVVEDNGASHDPFNKPFRVDIAALAKTIS